MNQPPGDHSVWRHTGSVFAQRSINVDFVTEALDRTSVMLWREQGKTRRRAAVCTAVVGCYARDGPLPRTGSLVTAAWRIG